MSRRAWIYVVIVILAGATLTIAALPGATGSLPEWPLFLLLMVFAILAHLFEAVGPNLEAWNANLVFYFAGLLLLNPFFFALLVIVPHLVHWIETRLKSDKSPRTWYVQPFNVATHLIAGFAARAVILAQRPDPAAVLGASSVLSTLGAVLIYVAVNHLLVTAMLVLGRRLSWRTSGILEIDNLVTDSVLSCLGYVFAVLWMVTPWLLLPALSPLVVIYRVLTIPQLKREAQTDVKTGLFNAGYFAETLDAEFGRAKNTGQPLSLIMADLDLLRNINNTFGHLAGDTVLVAVSHIIRDIVGDHGIAGRFGGEEFSVLLPGMHEADAALLAEKIRLAIAEAEFTLETSATPIQVTISQGVASCSPDLATSKDLIHEADVAMYQAKLRGRNAVVRAAAPDEQQTRSSQNND